MVSSWTKPAACYLQLAPIDSTATLAMRKSVSQSPLVGHVENRRHDSVRALMREALALGDVHSKSPG
jgi:hypothetical protein